MSAADPEYIAFACSTQLLLDIANTVDGVTSNPLEWYRRGHGACDHSRRELWFGRKADIGEHLIGKTHAADLESEMLNRGMFFEVVDWSENPRKPSFER